MLPCPLPATLKKRDFEAGTSTACEGTGGGKILHHQRAPKHLFLCVYICISRSKEGILGLVGDTSLLMTHNSIPDLAIQLVRITGSYTPQQITHENQACGVSFREELYYNTCT